MHPTNDDENAGFEMRAQFALMQYTFTLAPKFRFSMKKKKYIGATRHPFILDSKYLIGVSMKYENPSRYVFYPNTYNRLDYYLCVLE